MGRWEEEDSGVGIEGFTRDGVPEPERVRKTDLRRKGFRDVPGKPRD